VSERRWLRLWFSFRDPVDRRTYLLHGAGLMLLKYVVDATLVWAFVHRWWTPLGYLNPVWTVREQWLRGAPGWLAPAQRDTAISRRAALSSRSPCGKRTGASGSTSSRRLPRCASGARTAK